MLEAKTERTVIALGFCALLCFSFAIAFSKHKLPANLNFPFSFTRQQITEKSDAFLVSQDIDTRATFKTFKLASEAKKIIALERIAGVDSANKLLRDTPLYYWEIKYFDSTVVSFFKPHRLVAKVMLHPYTGRIIGFQNCKPQNTVQPLSLDEALKRAQYFLSSLGISFGPRSEQKWAKEKNDYLFEFRNHYFPIRDISEKLSVSVSSHAIIDFRYALIFPVDILQKFSASEKGARFVSTVLTFVVYGFTALALLIAFVHQRVFAWKKAVVFAGLMVFASSIQLLKMSDYLFSVRLPFFLGATFLNFCFVFGLSLVVAGSMYYCAQQSGISLNRIPVSSGIATSYIFAFTGLGITILFSLIIFQYFHPVSTLGFYKLFAVFPESRFTCFIPPLLSLAAAVSEEVFFRGFLISLLKRFCKNITVVVIMSTCLWAFAHITTMEYSDVFPMFTKGLFVLPIGFFLAFIFLRFGLAAAITTHYLYDLLIISIAFQGFYRTQHVGFSTAITMVSVFAPLLIVWRTRKHDA